jgi:hypothetical protein
MERGGGIARAIGRETKRITRVATTVAQMKYRCSDVGNCKWLLQLKKCSIVFFFFV